MTSPDHEPIDEELWRNRDYWKHKVNEELRDHEERIRHIEREVRDNTLIVSSARWAAMIVAGSSITLLLTFFVERFGLLPQ